MREYLSGSVLETEAIAKEFAKELNAGDVIAYRGGLGAGKTAFTRGLAVGLCLDAEVSSPTFALVHEYTGKELTLYHFDMYRINDFNDLYSTGYFDYLDLNQILAIEWSENIDGILEEKTIYIDIQTIDENTRKITISGGNRF